ncbi:MAG: alginate regulatory protein AlgP [Myxococcaceae bacterium]|nr:alginate regulatory protein AlgP [Myxococcaceae bacterium]
MSETPKKLRLDAVLREWPEDEKTPLQWEEMALRIDERVRSGAPGATAGDVSDQNLFAEPLGQIEGEGHNSAAISAPVKAGETRVSKGETMTMPADRERDRRSLQDLAKMAAGPMSAMTPPPPSVKAPHSSAPSGVQRAVEAKKDDSGIVDLAMASQSDPHAAVRAQSTPLASDGLFDDEPASVKPGPVSSGALGPVSGARAPAPVSQQYQQPAPSMPPFSAPGSAPASLPPGSISQPLSAPVSLVAAGHAVASSSQRAIVAPPKKGNGKVIALVLGGLVAVSSMAAGGFFFMKHRAAEQLAKNTAVTQPAITPAAPETKPVEAANTTPAPAADPSVDPNALPTATPDAKLAAAPKVAAKGGAPAAALAKNDKPAPAPVKEEGPKLSAKDLPTTPAGPGGDLGSAMGAAVGKDGKPVDPTPAAGNTGPQFAAGTVPQKPSQGAVTGAIGAVLPQARACLGPDDPVSRASITFTSAGAVQNVGVTGGAAGKPAEACIKAALGKAKVAPFAEATYTANITVRH